MRSQKRRQQERKLWNSQRMCLSLKSKGKAMQRTVKLTKILMAYRRRKVIMMSMVTLSKKAMTWSSLMKDMTNWQRKLRK